MEVQQKDTWKERFPEVLLSADIDQKIQPSQQEAIDVQISTLAQLGLDLTLYLKKIID